MSFSVSAPVIGQISFLDITTGSSKATFGVFGYCSNIIVGTVHPFIMNIHWYLIRAQILVAKDKSAIISPMWLVILLTIPMSTTLLQMLPKPSFSTPSHAVSPSYLSSSPYAQIISVSYLPPSLLSWHSSSPLSRWSSTLLSLESSNMKSMSIPARVQTSQLLSGWY